MHTLLRWFLAFWARLIIRLKKPYIIGVTGTAGKTTLTSFARQYLSEAYGEKDVMHSPYHYNGEYGLPLTIIGAKTGGKNPFLWLWVMLVALWRLCRPYPKYLVLEYGIDHAGEMDFLLSIAVPNIAIIAPIVENHIEQFGTLEAYRAEKLKILRAEHIVVHESLIPFVSGDHIQFYGLTHPNNVITAHNIRLEITGTHATVLFAGETYEVMIPALGAYQIENILPFFLIADRLGRDKNILASRISRWHLEPGRSQIFAGDSGSIVIDGTYNGGFLSIIEGIKSLRGLAETHQIFLFLGDMRELGEMEEEKHQSLAEEIITLFGSTDARAFLVWPKMRDYVVPRLEGAMRVYSTLSSEEAGEHIAASLQEAERPVIVYAKGSQNTIFLEEGLKKILPVLTHQSLCRQSESWLRRKRAFFASLKK